MKNNSFDNNFSDKNDTNNPNDEGSNSQSSKTNVIENISHISDHRSEIKSYGISTNKEENITEKVKEVTIISSAHYEDGQIKDNDLDSDSGDKKSSTANVNGHENTIASNSLETTDDPETVVRDLEARHLSRLHMNKLPPQARQILLFAASLHIKEGRGLTVGDLQGLRYKKDNAEKKIQDARRNGLLLPGEIRDGKQKQYYLSNYKHIIDKKLKKNKYKEIDVDKDITLQLLRLLSNKNYTYHNIHLATALNYKEDYDLLKWRIPSSHNKQKVMTFKLNLYRKCSIIVSPNGTVNITIECTYDPYEFHTSVGMIEFIGSCGQALNVLQEAVNNRLNVVSSIPEWCITQFDYNKDISINKMEPSIVSWTVAHGRLQIRYLGTIFQIYPKGLPVDGNYIRFEGHYNTQEKKKLIDIIPSIVDDHNNNGNGKSSLFVTAEDLLIKMKEK